MTRWGFNKSKEEGKGRSAFPSFALLSLFIVLVACLPIRLLVVSDISSGLVLSSWPMYFQREFTVVYTHSVERTDVTEHYRINRGDIYLIETIFSSYGAGLPSTTPYSFEITEEGFRIYDINEKMDTLIYRTGAVRANHRLIIGGRAIEFLSFSRPAEGVRFETKLVPLLCHYLKEVFL